jgi:hypothetical protein
MGLKPVVKILFEFLSEKEAFQKEKEIISKLDFSRLANMTTGGKGGSGYKFTNEQIEKISNASKGRTLTPEWCEKMSESMKEHWKTANKEPFSLAMKEKHKDPEFVKKKTDSVKEYWQNQDNLNCQFDRLRSIHGPLARDMREWRRGFRKYREPAHDADKKPRRVVVCQKNRTRVF